MEAMIFVHGGVTPQIPSVEAVKIVLWRVICDRECAAGVSQQDAAEFDLCLSNSVTFVLNAMECAKIVIARYQRTDLDGQIKQALIEMCMLWLNAPRYRDALRIELGKMRGWDRQRAAEILLAMYNRIEKERTEASSAGTNL